jgi:Phytanoyl-CoA dioxygenase (PhyH)
MLKNKQEDDILDTEGFVVIPFLSAEEVAGLKTFFYAAHNTVPEGMYATSHSPDFPFRQKMNEEIKTVCSRAMQTYFEGAVALGGTFMTKNKGEKGSLKPHQDWSIVDEERFCSYNIWIPLVDVDESNGTIQVLPRSHHFIKNIRGLNVSDSYRQVNNELWQYLKPLKMKAGEALVYDHRLMHASGINTTETPRLVIVYGVIPANAEMRFFYGRDNNIEVYSCTPKFFFTENIAAGPGRLPLLKTVPDDNALITSERLKQLVGAKQGFWNKVAALFN